jgi:hypothetical protein
LADVCRGGIIKNLAEFYMCKEFLAMCRCLKMNPKTPIVLLLAGIILLGGCTKPLEEPAKELVPPITGEKPATTPETPLPEPTKPTKPTTPGTTPELIFTSGQGSCTLATQNVSVWVEGRSIKFSGVIGLPTPCYTLNASYEMVDDGTIIIRIEKTPIGKYCIQCVGSISFKGEIRGLETGEYMLEIFAGKRLLIEESVVI